MKYTQYTHVKLKKDVTLCLYVRGKYTHTHAFGYADNFKRYLSATWHHQTKTKTVCEGRSQMCAQANTRDRQRPQRESGINSRRHGNRAAQQKAASSRGWEGCCHGLNE